MRRVVVTGLGAVTPIGVDAPSTWRAAVAGESGIDFIRSFDACEFPVRIAAEVKDFDPTQVASSKDARRLDRNVLLSLGAAREAVADADLDGAYSPDRVGILFGTAIGGFNSIVQQHDVLRERGPSRVAPTFLPNVLVDTASGQLAISLGFRGPNYAPVSACATGSTAIGEAAVVKVASSGCHGRPLAQALGDTSLWRKGSSQVSSEIAAITSCDCGAPRHRCRAWGRESPSPPAYEEKRRRSLGARAPQEQAPHGRARKRGRIVARRNDHRTHRASQ